LHWLMLVCHMPSNNHRMTGDFVLDITHSNLGSSHESEGRTPYMRLANAISSKDSPAS
jgi:hypothetical protein